MQLEISDSVFRPPLMKSVELTYPPVGHTIEVVNVKDVQPVQVVTVETPFQPTLPPMTFSPLPTLQRT